MPRKKVKKGTLNTELEFKSLDIKKDESLKLNKTNNIEESKPKTKNKRKKKEDTTINKNDKVKTELEATQETKKETVKTTKPKTKKATKKVVNKEETNEFNNNEVLKDTASKESLTKTNKKEIKPKKAKKVVKKKKSEPHPYSINSEAKAKIDQTATKEETKASKPKATKTKKKQTENSKTVVKKEIKAEQVNDSKKEDAIEENKIVVFFNALADKVSKKFSKQQNNQIVEETKEEQTKVAEETDKLKKRIKRRKEDERPFESITIVQTEEDIAKKNKTYKVYKKLRNVTIISTVSCLLLVFVTVLLITSLIRKPNVSDPTSGNISYIPEIKEKKYADSSYLDIWNEGYNKSFVKTDFVGQIIFESGIINEPVMQGPDNDTYLRRDMETYNYRVDGPVFLDYACDPDFDRNLILYGHNMPKNMDPDQVQLFTPLHLLEDKKNYEENKTINLVFEDRVEVYEVVSVYKLKVYEKEDGSQYLAQGEPRYFINNYTEEEFIEYHKAVKDKELYNTGVDFVRNDKLLTLQTCYETNINKLIVLAKQVDTLYYK